MKKIIRGGRDADGPSLIISMISQPALDELVATHKNEDILTDALGSKEHSGRRSNHPRSSIGSINIDIDVDEDMVNTPSNKGVEWVTRENLTISNPPKGKMETLDQPRWLVSIIDDKQEHSTMKDVVYSSNYIDVNGTIKLLNRHVVNNMKDVDMIRIPMNELIFERDKFVYLAREDLLHYCGMVEIGYMCILTYITFKIFRGLKTWQAKHDLQCYRSTPKWKPVKCPRQLDSVGCGYYGLKYIHEIISIPKMHIGKRTLTRFGQNGQVLDDCICCSTLWKCGKVDILEDLEELVLDDAYLL
uniref:Ubiquitin-like protease family profile domain-containing protein n=1 Tax=Cucumis melo TaxID=3656 RepID=A0A9I9E879_CUCME